MLNEIRAFAAFVETGSIHGAARRLHLTQPAVTRRVQRLEDMLGTALLERQHRPPQLTPAGKKAYEHALHILSAVEDLTSRFATEGEPEGELRLGLTHAVTQAMLAEHVDRIRTAYPRVLLAIRSGWSVVLLEQLRQGELDAAVIIQPQGQKPPETMHGHPLAPDRVVVVGRQDSPLPKAVQLADLASQPWVLSPEGCGFRTMLNTAFQREGLPPPTAVEVYGMELQLSLVSKGVGLGLVGEHLFRQSPWADGLQAFDAVDFDFSAMIWGVRSAFLGRMAPVVDLFETCIAEAMVTENGS